MVSNILDAQVILTVSKPAPVAGLGIPAIFVQGDTENYQEYTSIDALADDFDESTNVYKKADAVFAQINSPIKVAVITYTAGTAAEGTPEDVTATPTSDGANVTADAESGLAPIVQAAQDYWLNDWHFAMLDKFDAANALALSNFIDLQKYKFLIVQVRDLSDLKPLTPNARTIGLVKANDEPFDAALIGDAASVTVGNITWKFRHNLNGITPDLVTNSEFDAINKAHAIGYVTKAGVPQTTEGWTLSGDYIDTLHGQDWVKSNLETNLQTLLTNSPKISYDVTGIALLKATVKSTLETAKQQGIIAVGDDGKTGIYTVTAKPASEMKATDVAIRAYKGISFNYTAQNAIHTVVVYGVVEE